MFKTSETIIAENNDIDISERDSLERLEKYFIKIANW